MDAQQSYVIDIGRVLDSREDTIIPIQNYATKEPSLVDMSNYIADIYYTAINDALDALEGNPKHDLGRALLHELSHHVGVGVFDDLASDYIEGA